MPSRIRVWRQSRENVVRIEGRLGVGGRFGVGVGVLLMGIVKQAGLTEDLPGTYPRVPGIVAGRVRPDDRRRRALATGPVPPRNGFAMYPSWTDTQDAREGDLGT